jgi:hypothetical protein
MATEFDVNVALRRPPHGSVAVFGENAPRNKNFATAGAASTAALDLLGLTPLGQDVASFVLMRFHVAGAAVGTVIGWFAAGPAGLAAATNLDWPIYQDDLWEWLCIGPDDRYFRMIRNGAVDVDCDAYLTDVGT